MRRLNQIKLIYIAYCFRCNQIDTSKKIKNYITAEVINDWLMMGFIRPDIYKKIHNNNLRIDHIFKRSKDANEFVINIRQTFKYINRVKNKRRNRKGIK